MEYVNIEELKGKTIEKINVIRNKYQNDEIHFFTKDEEYIMKHEQECCENVFIEDIIGDIKDLINSPILMAEEVTESPYNEFYTWTFYKLATIKGYVTIRWYGESNGYYSESVSFIKQ